MVEVVVLDVRLLPATDFQLPAALGGRDIDALLLQAPKVIRPAPGINNMEGPIAFLEPVLDERHEHPVLLFLRVEEGTDVAGTAQRGAGKLYGLHILGHCSPSVLSMRCGNYMDRSCGCLL